jgi:hypothetical protein
VDDYLAALTARLADTQPLGEDELKALADERARAIADFLAEAGVASERVHVLESERTNKIVDGRVRLKLEMSKD